MKHFYAFTTFSTSGAIENRHFIFWKTPETRARKLDGRESELQTPHYRSNTAAFPNVPTPSCVKHHVHMCYHFHNHFSRCYVSSLLDPNAYAQDDDLVALD
jgi:hypothetical protein